MVNFPGATRLDIPVDKVLEGAVDADLKGVVIIGEDQDGELFLASSMQDASKMIWLIELAKFWFFNGHLCEEI